MEKITDDDLIAKIEAMESSSYGINDSSLTDSRSKALSYYNGDPFGNEIEGRSAVVSRDVLDVVESALPQLLKVFVSGDEIVRFDPRGPEDEEKAAQETAAVNYYILEKNDGFAIFYTWFKDALLSKNGYVKVWWEEEEETETETYQGLTDDQIALMLQDERIKVVEHTEYPDEIDSQHRNEAIQQLQAQQQNPQAMQQIQQIMAQPPKMCHDVKIEITETKGCIKVDNVAPEDIMVGIDTRTTSLQGSSFVQHRALMDRSEIEEQGWKVPDSAMTANDSSQWEEANNRNLYDESVETEAFEQYLVKDTYIRVSGETIRAVIIGSDIVHREKAEIVPFACITPHIMPHRHIGMSYSDLTEDIQLIKSTLIRGQLDNMYLSNNGRYAISDRVNLDDMLTSRPGGVVRVKGEPGNAIFPLQHAPFPPTSFQLVEYLDSAKEKRTGITAYNQGLDSNSLNKTATGVNQIMQATQQRVELVARTFANTGVKQLFMMVHRLVRKYNTRPEIIRLRDDWVTVDPREWKERNDMSISVGLGTGNKDQQLMHLNNLIALQFQALQAGLPFVTSGNVYNTARQLVINSGFKQPDQFVTDPKNVPPKPPTPDPKIQLKQMELKADSQKFQAQTAADKEESDKQSQLDIMKFQAEAAIDQQKADRVWQQEQLRSQNDVAIEREKIAAQMELERYKAELKAQTDLQLAQIQAEMQRQKMEQDLIIANHQSEISQKQHAEQMAQANKSKVATLSNGKQVKVTSE